MERRENLAIPQMPCPLVQPLPIRVPIPTIKPPATSSGSENLSLGTNASGHIILNMKPPSTKPAKKHMRHNRSPDLLLTTMPSKMPLTPVIRPLKSNIMIALRPIKRPPANAGTGVKFSTKYSCLI